MKCNVTLRVNVEVEIKAGNHVTILSGDRKGRTLKIRRIIETTSGTNVVFTDGTWRPISTYGTTWQ